ncbi:MAG: GAF domain-containing protein [Comamonadaceae bacterium]|nr:GAF domain-containing protein [Comamonadaceae bacterium]
MPRHQERKRHELDLLCRSGTGLVAIAPAVCQLARDMVGADAGSLFWLDEHGMPLGFFHENSPAQARDLFLNEFDRLFRGPNETNVVQLANRHDGPMVGQLLHVPAQYYRSNTFNLLVRPSGHHHALDLNVRLDGRTRAVLLLFRPFGQPFDDEDARALERIEPYLRRALASPPDGSAWSALPTRSGYLLVGKSHHRNTPWRLRLTGGEALHILQNSNLVGQNLRPSSNQLLELPHFIQQACDALTYADEPTLQRSVAVPGGHLCLTLTPLKPPGDEAIRSQSIHQILVTLELRTPQRLHLVQRLMVLPLSPLQREIALLAGVGGRRADCESAIGVSNEALKKHLKTIYRAVGVADWENLARALA